MTKEELIKLSRENLRKSKQGSLCECYDEAFIKGYELSKKRIAELEKETETLSQNLDDAMSVENCLKKRITDLEVQNKWLEGCKLELGEHLGKANDKIAELEKENAELKGLKDVATLIRANNDTVVTLMQLNNKLVSKSQQLTKAKELLERLLITSCNSDVLNLLPNCSEVLRVRVEAEQFLKGDK